MLTDFQDNFDNKTILRKIQAGANVYNNYTGNSKCFDMGTNDQIGADMWSYQVIHNI
jgi:hypothetical protein